VTRTHITDAEKVRRCCSTLDHIEHELAILRHNFKKSVLHFGQLPLKLGQVLNMGAIHTQHSSAVPALLVPVMKQAA
jgi:uncharacterized protein (DUF3084 family)